MKRGGNQRPYYSADDLRSSTPRKGQGNSNNNLSLQERIAAAINREVSDYAGSESTSYSSSVTGHGSALGSGADSLGGRSKNRGFDFDQERWVNSAAARLEREFQKLQRPKTKDRSPRSPSQSRGIVVDSTVSPKKLNRRNRESSNGTPENVAAALPKVLHVSPASSAHALEVSKSDTILDNDREETLRQQTQPTCMFDPNSSRRVAWDLGVILPCLAYLTIVMPFRLCFGNEPVGWIALLECSMDLLFMFDILINFRTGFVDSETGFIVYDYNEVAKEYLRTWFVLDVVSGIPFCLFDVNAFSEIRALKVLKGSRVLKAFKLLRFLKISRLIKGSSMLSRVDPETIDRFEDFLAEGLTRTFLRILFIMMLMGMMCHYMSCFWVLAGRQSEKDGQESWLHDEESFEFEAEETTGGSKVGRIYIAAYYFCFTTMTTVGYGDVKPVSNTERIICIILQGAGTFMYAYIIASFTSIVTMEDTASKNSRERMDAVSSYILKMELPSDLGRRMRRFFRHLFRIQTAIDEKTILMELSPSLRGELSKFLVTNGKLNDVCLFKCMNKVYWPKVLPLLLPCPLMRGEYLCHEGSEAVEAFILLDGELEASSRIPFEKLQNHKSCDKRAQITTIGSKTRRSSEASVDRSIDHSSFFNKNNIGGAVGLDDTISVAGSDYSITSSNSSRDGRTHKHRMRIIESGGMINILTILRIWEKSLETVIATERTECYSIHAEDFYATFKDDVVVLDGIQEYICRTQYEMMLDDTEAKTRFGVPLCVLDGEEKCIRTREYEKELEARKHRASMKMRRKGNRTKTAKYKKDVVKV